MKRHIVVILSILFLLPFNLLAAGDETAVKSAEVKVVYVNPIVAANSYNPYNFSNIKRQDVIDRAVAILENYGSDIMKRLILLFKEDGGQFLYSHMQQETALYIRSENFIILGPQVFDIDNIWSYPGIDKVIAYIIHEIGHFAIQYDKKTQGLPYFIEERIVNRFTFTQKQRFNKRMNIVLPSRRDKIFLHKVTVYSQYPDLLNMITMHHD